MPKPMSIRRKKIIEEVKQNDLKRRGLKPHRAQPDPKLREKNRAAIERARRHRERQATRCCEVTYADKLPHYWKRCINCPLNEEAGPSSTPTEE